MAFTDRSTEDAIVFARDEWRAEAIEDFFRLFGHGLSFDEMKLRYVQLASGK